LRQLTDSVEYAEAIPAPELQTVHYLGGYRVEILEMS
jgi:hypothetical protein